VSTSRSIVIGILSLLIVWQTIDQLPLSLHPSQDSWGLTDWLINYEGGFVRRGLGGAVLRFLEDWTGIQANHLAIAISVASYLGLGWWMLRRASLRYSPELLLSGVFLAFPAMQGTVVRKDCLLLLLLIACLKFLIAKRAPYIRWTLLNLTVCVGILLHETFAFVAIPALALHSHSAVAERIPRRIALLSPSLICLALVIVHHGSPSVALAIHQSWQHLWQETCVAQSLLSGPFSTIGSIGWTAGEGTALTKGILQTGLYQPAAWLFVTITGFLITLHFVHTRNSRGEPVETARLILIQFAAVFPLFFVGIDYGRWVHFCAMSSVILRTCDFTAPHTLWLTSSFTTPLQRWPNLVHPIPGREWILLLFGLPILWSARNFMLASPIGRILSNVTEIHMLP
jgi:hypothetical protein